MSATPPPDPPAPQGPRPTVRSATVSWPDPAELIAKLVGLGGLAYVEAVRDGALPGDPLMEAMGIAIAEAGPGRTVMTVTPAELHLNLGGMIHGGFLSTLMDSCTGFALHTLAPPGTTSPHVSASYAFLRAGHAGVPLRCTAEVLRRGARVGHVRAEVVDAHGRLLATGETTHAVIEGTPEGGIRSGPLA